MSLFNEAKKHWRRARPLQKEGQLHAAFMALGQARWCLTREKDMKSLSPREIINPGHLLDAINGELQRMKDFMTEDPFAALDLDFGASGKDVKKAYRTLIRRWHPDKQQDKRGSCTEQANELFIILQHANDLLSNESERVRVADRLLRKERMQDTRSLLRRVRHSRASNAFASASSDTRTKVPDRKTKKDRARRPTSSKQGRTHMPTFKRKQDPSTRRTPATSSNRKMPSASSSRSNKNDRTNAKDGHTKQRDRSAIKASSPTEGCNVQRQSKSASENCSANITAADVLRAAAKYNAGAATHHKFTPAPAQTSSEAHTRKTKDNADATASSYDVHEFVKRFADPPGVAKTEAPVSGAHVNATSKANGDGGIRVRAGPEREDVGDVFFPSEENNWLLSPPELVALRAHFAAVDDDDDGYISVESFMILARALGERVEKDEVVRLTRRNTKDPEGKISFSNFVEWWQSDDDDTLLPPPHSMRALSRDDASDSEKAADSISETKDTDRHSTGGHFWGSARNSPSSKNAHGHGGSASSRTEDNEGHSTHGHFWGSSAESAEVKAVDRGGPGASDGEGDVTAVPRGIFWGKEGNEKKTAIEGAYWGSVG